MRIVAAIILFFAHYIFSAQVTYADDLPVSCASIQTTRVDSGVALYAQIVNQCGQCAHISVNWTLDGKFMDFAGTYKNVPAGSAVNYTMPLNRGFGTHQIVVVRVQTCT